MKTLRTRPKYLNCDGNWCLSNTTLMLGLFLLSRVSGDHLIPERSTIRQYANNLDTNQQHYTYISDLLRNQLRRVIPNSSSSYEKHQKRHTHICDFK